MADTKIIIQQNPTEQEQLEYKRRLFETADRSFVNDRLNVELPEGLHGEWIGTDDFSQYHAQLKGFVDGSEFLKEFNRLHETSTGPTVGDVKFMVIPKWKYEAQQEMAAMESARRSGLNSREVEEQYKSYAQQLQLGIINSERTSAEIVSGTELQAKLKG